MRFVDRSNKIPGLNDTPDVLLLHWGRRGAGPKFLIEMATEWSAQTRHGSRTLISYSTGSESLNRARLLNLPAFEVRTYSNWLGAVLGVPRLGQDALRLRHYIRKERVGLVISPMESLYQSLVLPMILSRSITYVVCIHDAEAHPGETHLLKRLTRALELWRADVVVTFSAAVAERLRARGDLEGCATIELFHPAFEPTAQPATNRVLDASRPPTLGFFGRLLPYKGLGLLLDAARLLRQRGYVFELTIIGDGPEAWRANVASGANWDIRWVPDEEVADCIGSFDLLVVPYIEASQSGPVAYALTAGIPCVVTPVGGLVEQVGNGGFGAISTSVTAEAFADAVASVLDDPAAYQRMSFNALASARGHLSWESLVGQLKAHLDQYEESLHARS